MCQSPAGGKVAFLTSGKSIELFERKLRQVFLVPLPHPEEYDAATHRIEGNSVRAGKIKFPCVQIMPSMLSRAQNQPVPLGWFPTYCFEPILRAGFSLGGMTTEFGRIVKVQGRFLARQIVIIERGKKILTAQVDEINGIRPAIQP